MKPPFRSAFASQLWHECRRNAISLPLIFGFSALPVFPVLCLGILNADSNRDFMFGSTRLTPAQLALAIWFGVPLLLSGTFGPGMAKFDFWGKDPMISFFAIRPMTTSRFVLIKLLAALISAAVVWIIIMALFAFWIALEASFLNPHPSMVRAAWAKATPQGIAVLGGVLIGFMGLMWRNIVISMWPTLTGRRWFSTTIGFALMIEFSLLSLAGAWVYRHPEFQPRLIELVPWFIGTAVALKLAAAAGVIAALQRRRLVEARATKVLVALWGGVCGVLLVLLSLVVSPTLLLAAGIVLFVPLTRLAASPLALHSNRHR